MTTLVIGGGQAGLAVGYYLSRRGEDFLIVDANQRTGDSWRNRWDSLRLFTPNRFNSLPGLKIRGERWGFPSKDELAAYLERYAEHFELPIRHGAKVEHLEHAGDRFIATAGDMRIEADNVVVAMSSWQESRVPPFAAQLDDDICQVHSADYQNPAQLADGDVLVVGAGNSGADIAMELSRSRRVWLAGPSTGALPFRPKTLAGKILMPFVGRVILHRVLSLATPIGRRARPKMIAKGEPLIRVKPKDLAAAGVERTPRVVGVEGGLPQLQDGRVLEVSNVLWCTGFHPGFSWIDLPVFDGPRVVHDRGISEAVPGLYFVGLKYLYAPSSANLHGVGRDAEHVVSAIASWGRKPLSAGARND